MKFTMKRIVGWQANHPHFLRRVPTHQEDLVWEVQNIFADFDWPDVYGSQVQAWEVANGYLMEMRNQALADIGSIELFSKPITLDNCIFKIYTFPRGFVECQIQKARQQLRIAEAGLTLCP